MSEQHRRRAAKLKPLHQKFEPAASRRQFLHGLAAGSAVLSLSGCGSERETLTAGPEGIDSDASEIQFLHGVASGDPLSDRVILWTRVTPAQPELAGSIGVNWVIATDPALENVVNGGTFVTDAERDYTVKFDATGLMSNSTYYYQFAVGELRSPVGRTRTAPASGDTERLRMAVCACSNYTFGYFNGYGAIARRADLDVVVHLGDYIYETGGGSQLTDRDHFPAHEIITLQDYRQRYAQYRQDPDLQEAHRQHPWILIWDDHETTNNSYHDGAANHDDSEGDWTTRMGWAVRAYFEWLPIRDNADNSFDAPEEGLLPEGHGRIYRRLAYGDLVDLIMLDTRLAGRAPQNGTDVVSPEQTILGDEQREWLFQQLRNSQAQWKLIAQQMTFAPIKTVPLPEDQGGGYLNEDAWDGYRYDRNAVMQLLQDEALDNVVILSGDTHVVTAFDVPVEPSDPTRYNPVSGDGSLAVEFSSNGIANVGIIGEFFMANNPHLKFSNLVAQGYLLLDIDAQRTQGEYYFTGAPNIRDASEVFAHALSSTHLANRLQHQVLPSSERGDAPILAP